MDILTQIDQLKAEIDALRPIDEVQEQQIMQKFRLEWTYHSNAIEGNTLTFGETKAFLLHGITAQGRPFRDYVEMRGHHQAIDALLEIIRQNTPLTETAIRELHKIILVEPYDMPAQTASGQRATRRITPGNYKTMPNHVQTSSGEMHYYASPEATPARMADLMAWYRQTNDHPLIMAATFHYEFVKIHPFDDGNGRLARLLMNLILMQSGFPPLVVRTDNKESYLLALEQADADDNLEPFINLVGDSLLQSMRIYLRGARGESIDEVDDLDKKLALLKKKIHGQKVEKEQQEAQLMMEQAQIKTWLANDFIEYVVNPFFDNLLPQSAKFSKFFKKSLIDPSLDVFLSQLDVNKPCQIRQSWQGFEGDNRHTLHMIIEVQLRDEAYTIHSTIRHGERAKWDTLHAQSLLNGRYGYIPTEQEIETAVNTITNDIYQLIEQKVASTSGN